MGNNGNRRSTDPLIININREVGEMSVLVKEMHADVKDHRTRIGAIEDNQNRLIWGTAGFSAAVSSIVAAFAWLFK